MVLNGMVQNLVLKCLVLYMNRLNRKEIKLPKKTTLLSQREKDFLVVSLAITMILMKKIFILHFLSQKTFFL